MPSGNSTTPEYRSLRTGGTRLLLAVLIANLHTTNLAANGLWQFVDKLDDTRILVGSRLSLDVLLQFLDEVVASLVLPLLA